MATILIVDDHVLNREFLLTLLGYGGHRLIEASDGVEGLRLLREQRPQLVISDILMPNMDGYEFVTRMHADPDIAEIPVIFYTATYREREANVMALACGVRWVLPKPSEPEVILQTVNQALGLHLDGSDLPVLQSPPQEGSRFSTIENQLSEYVVELQTITNLMWQGVNGEVDKVPEQDHLEHMAPRLSRALFNLQAVSLRLTALIELGIELAAEHDPKSLVDVGCRVIHNICVAKYACVGTFDDDGEKLSQFSMRGLDDKARAQFALLEPRTGVLGKLIEGRLPYRVSASSGELKNLGFPAEHAPTTSFLGVAIASRARVYGWLYLVDKIGAEEFNEVDERVVTTVATQMAVAYENLTLYEETQRQHDQLKAELDTRTRLTEDLRRFRMAMDATADAILLIDCADMRFLDVNNTASRMLGYTREEIFFLGPKSLGIGSCGLTDSLVADDNNSDMVESHLQLQHKDGSPFSVEMHRRILRSNGRLIMVAVIRDVTERRETEQKLIHLAHYDTLTGLPNRTLFYASLKRILMQAQDNHWIVAVLFIDLDRFKNVNDTLGHLVGDELLRQFGKRLTQCMRMRDIVGRFGGDEFALILVMPEGRQDAIFVTNKIREVLQQPFNLMGHEINATASIGITLYPHDAEDSETLIKYADTAMYQAKEAGGDGYRFFTAEMNIQAMARLDLENALHKALENNEFTLYYQPKVQLDTGCVTGVEALVRWNRPGHGLVSPGQFIPLLEEIGSIVRVGTWAINEACRQIAAWMPDIGPVHVSVNVSGKQFFDGDLEADVMAAIVGNGIEPELLELELTEATFMANTEEVITVLRKLKARGLQVSIDDFGTGYSSLAYLKRFPIDTLKIDIAFIRDITTNTDDAAITQAIISMAHSLKLRVIAEGVETEAQLTYLRRLHCDQIQGYYFSRPLPAHEFTKLLQQNRCLPAIFDGVSVQKTLLIVDDDAVVISVLSRLLHQDGYRVLTASTAAEGFELLAKNEVQVILCDQCMPVMNGSEFLNRVKDLYPNTFRIMLSGNRELQSIVDALNSGAIFRFYTKPWESKVLRENIREAFRQNARAFSETVEKDRLTV